MFLVSLESATALTGLFLNSKISNFIVLLYGINAPFHLLGLNGLIGVSARNILRLEV